MQDPVSLDYDDAAQLLKLAQSRGWPLWKVALVREARLQNCGEEDLLERMTGHYRIMRQAVRDGLQITNLSPAASRAAMPADCGTTRHPGTRFSGRDSPS